MENNRLLYDQYKYEKENTHDGIQNDVIKRIENYRRDVNLYNSLRTIPSDRSIQSQKDTKGKNI
jgi:hypothetical protein